METVGNLLDTVVEDIGETKQHRRADITHLKLVHHLLEVDRGISLAGTYHYVAALVYRKIVAAPAIDVVQLLAVLNTPFSHRLVKIVLCSFSVFIFVCISAQRYSLFFKENK